MIAHISKRLINVYSASKKNVNYQLDFLLNSLDMDTCDACMKLVEEFKLIGETQEIAIDESNVKRIQRVFGSCNNSLIEQLLWVALMFPEI